MNETKKLSGPAKDRFFKRFFVEAGGLDDAIADRLTERSSKIFTSVRVRKNADDLLAEKTAGLAGATASPEAPSAPESKSVAQANLEPVASSPSPRKTKKGAPPAKQVPPAEAPAPAPAPEPAAADPFAFGLVPVYKREGPEGLSAKLATIGSAEHLRAMAKAQQIVLARDLRTGDIDITALRTAILEAVEKRVADRRAI